MFSTKQNSISNTYFYLPESYFLSDRFLAEKGQNSVMTLFPGLKALKHFLKYSTSGIFLLH